MLGNLLDNALRHGESTVTLSAAIEDGEVELHVRDQGSGLPTEFLSRAFERFTRADDSRSGRGAGLGLAIAQTIARVHRGHAMAANHPEGGADVAIRLPFATEGVAAARRPAVRDPGAKPAPPRASK